ncbi:universal stress protein [Halovulum dunhuangense]|uniref:Universal stress protein n=2 Tax=Halovulum dunhuangense TaxID=1505036 RepID=A0A849L3J6_9RHOB|nr:universal stress protein [Halovulum dunhuangense]
MTILVGLDGSDAGQKALAHAKAQAGRMEGSRIILCYVIEWSPFSFQTPEENEQRHRRREEEISIARARVIEPALAALASDGFDAEGVVRHGHAADILEKVAREKGAAQIVVARESGGSGLRNRIFGSVTGNLVASASVPVTVVPT